MGEIGVVCPKYKNAIIKYGVPRTHRMRIAAMAYRAEVKRLKKDGKVGEALLASEKLLATRAASDNDRKIHEKLNTKVA